MRSRLIPLIAALVLLGACSAPSSALSERRVAGEPSAAASGAPAPPASAPSKPKPSSSPSPSRTSAPAKLLPKPGNPDGHATVPSAARAIDTSHPTRKVGSGTPASCTSSAVVKAVAAGGIITFDCGPAPVTITMTATAKVRNASSQVVLDGGGRVTLSGGGKRRILYMNTCDEAQGFTTSHCQDQDTPRLTLQNLVFSKGNSTGDKTEGGGGGAVFVRGGHVKVVNSRFTGNRCDRTGPDLGGAALRVLDQGGDDPVYVSGSTFTGGVCSNGSALSSIGVSWIVLNSVFQDNEAVGNGANPARSGTPGGGSGGAIYLDGNRFTLTLDGTLIEDNKAVEGGGAVFFVSNDRTGTMTIRHSTLRRNKSAGFETAGLPGIFFLGAGKPSTSGSKLTG
ncbi:hypothetical protein HH310_22855 [Actinoplanes sp. TBRC 11911]|uniref:hypothetical protein n=1 Tax=Actinoplanes sp. TBRC 11911 TaxID=2729386 RepID=UPI00145E8D48|nr:hypothetical protein [Actinoplanes sp. TBRC 11911]NMO54009.1 hypothetical protein [Actinoplanes sp. TBRC 11911]